MSEAKDPCRLIPLLSSRTFLGVHNEDYAVTYMDDPEGTPSLRSLRSLVQNDKVCLLQYKKDSYF